MDLLHGPSVQSKGWGGSRKLSGVMIQPMFLRLLPRLKLSKFSAIMVCSTGVSSGPHLSNQRLSPPKASSTEIARSATRGAESKRALTAATVPEVVEVGRSVRESVRSRDQLSRV